ncbi:AraC family transcriptional regulator [Thalassospira sp. MA62]|nr:AraC family transcriptional regulator [Thalassospira sp. MA62]
MLEKSRFSLEELPKAERFDVWKESINCIYSVDTDRRTRSEGFRADLNSWRHNDMMAVEAKSGSQTFSRTPRMIAEDGMDHYNVQIYTNGSVQSDKGTGGDILKAGGILMLDLSQPTEAQSSEAFDSLHLFLPRSLVEDKLTHPDDHNLRFMSERDPLVQILHNQILMMNRNIDQFSDQQIATLKETTAMLLAACLNASYQENNANRALRQDIDKLLQVRRYFRENLLSPDLNVKRAAQDLGLSRTNLYGFFKNQGGVNQYVRDMRLQHALRLLSDPSQRSRSIYDIALECGYASDTGFIRAFRAKYELTPGDIRAGHSPHSAVDDKHHLDKRYETWLHTLA